MFYVFLVSGFMWSMIWWFSRTNFNTVPVRYGFSGGFAVGWAFLVPAIKELDQEGAPKCHKCVYEKIKKAHPTTDNVCLSSKKNSPSIIYLKKKCVDQLIDNQLSISVFNWIPFPPIQLFLLEIPSASIGVSFSLPGRVKMMATSIFASCWISHLDLSWHSWQG